MLRKVAAMLAVLLVLSSAGGMTSAQDGMTFVLVHGAFQDASAWALVTPELEAEGHTVIAVNLPGRGEDMTPAGELTLDAYRDAVAAVIAQQDGPVILVGHSFGGMVISAVAEAIPNKIAGLVYVAAYLPQSGDSVLSIAASEPGAEQGGFIVSDDQTLVSVPSEAFPLVFCGDCTPDQAVAVAASQISEPFMPLAGTVTLTDANFGAIDKTYVLTAFDAAVSPTLQIMMLANTPVAHVYALQTGHVPYITAPEALATLLLQAAEHRM